MCDAPKMPTQNDTPTLAPPPQAKTRGIFWGSVAASIVASIIIIFFIQPFVPFVSSIVVGVVSLFYHGYVNGIYKQAAINTTDAVVLSILGFVTLFPAGVMLGAATSSLFFMRVLKRVEMMDRINTSRIFRVARNMIIVVSILFTPYLFIVNERFYVACQASATFQQRMMALAPVLSDVERKALLSQWALMKGRDDYDKINTQLEGIASNRHVEIPPALI
jgi:hypothetical protein